jgi:hypothetical protein
MNARFRYDYNLSFYVTGTITLILLACSCSDSVQKNKPVIKNQDNKSITVRKPPSSFEDTIVIDYPSAVFYNPDSLQLDKIKSVYEKRVYETMTHDCFYMMQNAREVLKKHWPRIRIVEVKKARYLLFVKKDRSRFCIDLNKKKNICGMYIFDLKKDPEMVDMPNVDTFLGFYFGQN